MDEILIELRINFHQIEMAKALKLPDRSLMTGNQNFPCHTHFFVDMPPKTYENYKAPQK